MDASDVRLQLLEVLVQRAKTFVRTNFYNREVVSPYLLAAHGFVSKGKTQKYQASCQAKNCRSVIHFDGEEDEVKENLDSALCEHSSECDVNKQGRIFLTNSLVFQVGHRIYSNNIEAIKNTTVNIRLNWKEIQQVLTESEEEIILRRLFQHTEAFISDRSDEVQSSAFLALFGWKIIKREQFLVGECFFCNSSPIVSSYVLMRKTTNRSDKGFSFLESHKAWCSIVASKHWLQMLKSVAYESLPERAFDQTPQEILKTEMQNKLLFSYSKYHERLTNLTKQLEEGEGHALEQQQQVYKRSYQQAIGSLKESVYGTQEIVRQLLKKVKTKN